MRLKFNYYLAYPDAVHPAVDMWLGNEYLNRAKSVRWVVVGWSLL